ncbi:MAG: type IV pilus twitching motility protein PilT [Acidobacteriota bacterium]
MSQHEQDLLFGRLAVHYKVLTKEQVGASLQQLRQVGDGMDLGQFLVSQGALSPEVVQKLERARAAYLQKQGKAPAAPVPSPAAPVPSPAAPAPAAPAPAPTGAPASAAPPPVAPVAATQPLQVEPPAAPAAPSPAASIGSGSYKLQFGPQTTLEQLLQQTRQLGASDLHVHCQAPLRLRLHGTMTDASPMIDKDRARELIYSILSEAQRAELEDRLQLDFAYSIPGVGRFRANAYQQQRGLDAVFRAIPPEPPTLAELGLPADLERVVQFHQGIVLFTGPAGCGKSSTMAAMVRLINEDRPDHIITVEDPIEYVHRSALCLVNQRQVGPHTESFARALRAALREDPDIIAIGELRDLETISLALTAAETGHLVLGTLHTSSAIRTINRLLGVFPPDQQNQIRTMVSESLRAVVSQRLVPRADGEGRAAALEVLMNTRAVGNLIRDNKTFQIHSQMQTGGSRGMVLLDNSLAELVKQGTITQEEARRNAEDPKRFA